MPGHEGRKPHVHEPGIYDLLPWGPHVLGDQLPSPTFTRQLDAVRWWLTWVESSDSAPSGVAGVLDPPPLARREVADIVDEHPVELRSLRRNLLILCLLNEEPGVPIQDH